MHRPACAEITGLILAGGRGVRMGGADKGLIVLDGLPLAMHVRARLEPQVASVLVSANRNSDRYAELGLHALADPPELPPWSGPLAGLLAACRAARTDWLAVVPCDMPRLPTDLVARLSEGLGTARAAMAFAGGHRQPLCALLDVTLAQTIAASLASDERRVAVWLANVGAAEVQFDDVEAFANLNTLAQLGAAGMDPRR